MNERRRVVSWMLLLAATAPAVLLAAENALPGNHRQFELRLTRPAMLEEMSGNLFSLPQFRVYDLSGAQVLDLGKGYEHESFDRQMRATLARPEKTGAARTLADELARFEGADLSNLPAAELTIVELWAEWCVPCHELGAQLSKLLADHPTRRIDRLHVNANPEKILEDGVTIGDKKPLDLPDEIRKQVTDPSLGAEERGEILRKFLESQKKNDDPSPPNP